MTGPPATHSPAFWWYYGVGGVLGWAAVGVIWWHTGNLEFAFEAVYRGVGGLGSWAGMGFAAVWLGSTALALGAGLVFGGPALLIVWLVERRRAR